MKQLNITGIVLAGGMSSRMGQDKSLMEFNGMPLIQHAVDTLKTICHQVVISSNRHAYEFTGCEVWPDELEIQAPVTGIYTCIRRSATGRNIILSCDMPLVDSRLFEYLIKQDAGFDAIIPVHERGIEPLCGVYNKTAVPVLAANIAENQFSLQQFIREANSSLVEIGPALDFYRDNLFANVNTPGDFSLLLNM